MSDRRLCVVQVLPALESGGVERGTLEVGRELVRRGHRSLVISAGGRLVRQLCDEGSEHLQWPIGSKSLRAAGCVLRLRRLLVRERVDVLHARSRIPAWVGWLAWRRMRPACRPRFVTTMHGLHSVNRFSRIMTQGEAVIAVSQAVREHILHHYPDVPPDRVRLIHRGIDPAAFPFGYRPPEEWLARWRKDFPQLSGRRLLTLAGRITRLKGHHHLLDLLCDLKGKGLPVHGIVAGDEDPRRQSYARELHARAEAQGLAGDVTFMGHRSDIREIYSVSDVVLSLSTKPESFGRTTLEPLALGVPVVGYDHGGVGEILRAVFPQGAVPLGDRGRLHDCVCSLLNSTCTQVAPFEQFRLQSMLDETLELYSRLACGNSSASVARAA